ncbi:helix-turn-helix transcriptional regulator [Mameliella sediminis]|uniref:helix-turn-helix transcriptional regulator n=1 Tax=Mameliella sediminis TaxID=2836866 RepID=UPI001C44E265|nr:YafY family protein [Mameliella sediminis]MBY6116438.1 YafY family transcriptional regulator [Antarctobacter heliothermus]MBY6145536.1 YafY family transcriptional regulator [Mameliella alba]MBV7393740.1 YafY family transcriptional regulator [Mameliella sediminis]MBY6160860.1 YafY family transcriptional regulator [Mameliella alba]MBY6169330.1 YafY family transcriptional regulator [Mameliella alba]
MRRADRLFQIVQALRGGRRTTAAQLADRLEVSQRTIYRDIADLQSTGVPIDGEAGFGYVLQEGFDLPPLMFDKDEIVALVAGARLVRAWGGATMARAAEEALAKIDAVLPEDARARARAVQVHSLGLGVTDDLRACIDAIESAVDRRERLQLEYRDEAGQGTTRIVRPLGLWFWAPAWTLVAWCELREDFRMFRLDRIAALQEAGRFRHERGQRLADFYERMEAERCG